MMIPMTFSIANGLAFGFTSYTVLRVVRGEWSKVNWLMYVLTGLFVLRFVYLAGTERCMVGWGRSSMEVPAR